MRRRDTVPKATRRSRARAARIAKRRVKRGLARRARARRRVVMTEDGKEPEPISFCLIPTVRTAAGPLTWSTMLSRIEAIRLCYGIEVTGNHSAVLVTQGRRRPRIPPLRDA